MVSGAVLVAQQACHEADVARINPMTSRADQSDDETAGPQPFASVVGPCGSPSLHRTRPRPQHAAGL